MTDGAEIQDSEILFGSLQKDMNLMMEELTLKNYTFQIIQYFMEKYHDTVLLVAKKLDIGKSTIYRYLKEMEEI